MKDNKGFTLVEIISVIVLLGIIVIITVPTIMTASTNVKKKTLQTKVDNIEKAAVLYGQKHREKFTISCSLCDGVTGECSCYNENVYVETLRGEGYIKYDDGISDIKNSVDDSQSLLDCEIQIYKKYGKIYAVYDKDTNKTKCWYN